MEYGYEIADRYICRKPLGKGANGNVYLVFDQKLCKYWAAKACSHLSDQEIFALKSINHYAFPRIVDVIEQDSYYFLIMDYIEGETLASHCNNRVVNERQLVRWFKKIASALSYLHNLNPQIFYVDCKPENIMVTPSGDIRIVDFGSIYVCSDEPQSISGTKFYAPKELNTQTPSVTSDIYSLGMTMYRLLTKSSVEYRDKSGNLCPEHINKNISKSLVSLIKKCTSFNPKSRIQSMSDIVKILSTIGNHRTVNGINLPAITKLILKCSLGAIILLIAKINVHHGLLLIIPLLCLLFLLCKKPTFYTWETHKDIYKSSIVSSLMILLFLPLLLSTRSSAQTIKKDTPFEECLNITLYDNFSRKLLVKPGATWIVDQDIFFSLDKNEIQPDSTIVITCTNNNGSKSYSFKCSPIN